MLDETFESQASNNFVLSLLPHTGAELIIKDYECLFLASFEEMFIDTMNIAKNVGIASRVFSGRAEKRHRHFFRKLF